MDNCPRQAFTTPYSVLHKDKDFLPDAGLQKSSTEFPLTSTVILQGHSLPQSTSDPDSKSPSKTSKETPLLCKPSTITQQTSTLTKDICSLSFADGRPLSQASRGFHPVLVVPVSLEPNSISSISDRVSSRQAVHSLHESLNSTCIQQCVHDPGLTPISLAQLLHATFMSRHNVTNQMCWQTLCVCAG